MHVRMITSSSFCSIEDQCEWLMNRPFVILYLNTQFHRTLTLADFQKGLVEPHHNSCMQRVFHYQ